MQRILIVEDDELTAELLKEEIESKLADLQPEVEILETEAEFVLHWLPAFKKGTKPRPDAIVLDVMLRWTDASPDQPPRPPEVIEGGFAKAGFRCYGLIQDEPRLAHSKVILFTNLEETDMAALGGKSSGALSIQKGNDEAILKPLRVALETNITSGNIFPSSADSVRDE